ncbi:MAG: hybrid sensor histidine kinase/response regulator [Candidatus Dadabacteria bacterium]|nr:MAG: hybrid sensor histidine kinase/response regulator [Candidatus Dadabacteria bacterium]
MNQAAKRPEKHQAKRRLLLVEDNPGDARLFVEALREVGASDFDVTHVERFGDARARLEAEPFDVVLLDLGLPDAEGLGMVSALGDVAPQTPVVVLTGRNDESLAVEAVRAGAEDYLIKGQIEGPLLVRSIRYAIERHRLVEALKDQNRQLEHFAFATAHDLKAPLGNIEQSIELLRCEEDGGELPELTQLGLKGIEVASRRMRRLVTDLLVLGRAGSRTTAPEVVELSEFVASVAETFEQEAQAKGVRLELERTPMRVVVRRRDLEAVLANVLGNAIKYIGQPESPRVEVGWRPSDGEALVWVRDNGPGFDPAQAEAVFEPYRRLSTDQEGTGLGLAIVKKAVEAHGGRAWIQTQPGQGTTVFFTAPLAPAGDCATSRPEDASAGARP